MSQTAHCPDHGIEQIAQVWAERRNHADKALGIKCRVTFPCGQSSIVVMSRRTFEDVGR